VVNLGIQVCVVVTNGVTCYYCRLLQNNQLTGPIPSELGQLSELETLDLSGNRFSGEIPASLGFLTHLNYL